MVSFLGWFGFSWHDGHNDARNLHWVLLLFFKVIDVKQRQITDDWSKNDLEGHWSLSTLGQWGRLIIALYDRG